MGPDPPKVRKDGAGRKEDEDEDGDGDGDGGDGDGDGDGKRGRVKSTESGTAEMDIQFFLSTTMNPKGISRRSKYLASYNAPVMRAMPSHETFHVSPPKYVPRDGETAVPAQV